MMEEIKAVFTEKYKFEFEDESISIAHFGIFELPGFRGNEQEDSFPSNHPTLFYIFQLRS